MQDRVEVGGVGIGYEVRQRPWHDPAHASWQLVTSRFWKLQAPLPGAAVPRDHVRRAGQRPLEHPFEEDPGRDEGWARSTRASWRRDFPGFAELFSARCTRSPTARSRSRTAWAGVSTRHGHTRALEVEDATPDGVAAARAARIPELL